MLEEAAAEAEASLDSLTQPATAGGAPPLVSVDARAASAAVAADRSMKGRWEGSLRAKVSGATLVILSNLALAFQQKKDW
jgi:hypothetical protein